MDRVDDKDEYTILIGIGRFANDAGPGPCASTASPSSLVLQDVIVDLDASSRTLRGAVRYIRCNANWSRRAGRVDLAPLLGLLQCAEDSGEVGHLPGGIALERGRSRVCDLGHSHLRVYHRISSQYPG